VGKKLEAIGKARGPEFGKGWGRQIEEPGEGKDRGTLGKAKTPWRVLLKGGSLLANRKGERQ